MNEQEIRRYLEVIKRAVTLIEAGLGNEPQVTAASIAEPVKPDDSRKTYINSLMQMADWPETVPQFQIKEPSDIDQQKRAKAVLDMMLTRNIEGTNFLDFGCGEGWLADEALRRGAAIAQGYDAQRGDKWPDRKAFLTSHFHEIKSQFDIIMLYDVLDHTYDPIDVMAKVKSLLKPDGVVYVRCHPWTSKHASHLFRQGVNKAYFHLFLKWEEIAKILNGPVPVFTRTEKDPLPAYHHWFQQFKVTKENVISETVNGFFQSNIMKKFIQTEQGLSSKDIDAFLKRMEIQFVDYRLEL